MWVPDRFLAVLAVLTAMSSPLSAAAPTTVSPGGVHQFEEVLGRCPTFHWAAVPGAESLELLIYGASALDAVAVAESPVVRVSLPPTSQGWTPSRGRCLAAGDGYAWSLGATFGDGSTAWSETRLFRIWSAPTALEMEEALEVLRRYRHEQAAESELAIESTSPAGSESEAAERRAARVPSRRAGRAPGSKSEVRPEAFRERPLRSESVGAGPGKRAPIVPTSTSLDVEADFELGRYVFKDGQPFIHTSPGPTSQNTAVGLFALNSDAPGSGSTAIGYGALQDPAGIDQATAVGVRAHASFKGDRNTAIGYEALMGDTYSGAFDNTAVGWHALVGNYAGARNTAIGSSTLTSTDYASGNTAVGFEALKLNFNGYYNTAVGTNALSLNLFGQHNTAMGAWALYRSSNASLNTAVGAYALYGNDQGEKNVAVGYKALFSNTTIAGPTGTTSGEYNTAIGEESMRDNTVGEKNTAVGEDALRGNTTGSNNTALGENAMVFALAGERNTAVGQDALRNVTGSNNTGVGENALFDLTSADGNTALGRAAGLNITTGYGNILIGESAGANLQTGFDNIVIGSFGGPNEFEAQTIRIGDPIQQNRAFMAGVRGVFTPLADAIPVLIDSAGQMVTENSSRRFKTEIRDLGDVSSTVRDLRPVSFRFKRADEGADRPTQFGLIAEEVAEVLPELVVYDEAGTPEGVFYRYLTPILLKEVQTQQRRIRNLQTTMGVMGLMGLMGAMGVLRLARRISAAH